MDDYLRIIMDKEYDTNREMLILLVGESKQIIAVPYLKELSTDDVVIGHVLIALGNYYDDEIVSIMKKHTNHPIKWISDVAKQYLATH